MIQKNDLLPIIPLSTSEQPEQKSWRGFSEPGLLIRHLEELSLNALPALETTYLDGWVVRLPMATPNVPTRLTRYIHPPPMLNRKLATASRCTLSVSSPPSTK